MRLGSLELSGFRGFRDTIQIDLAPGATILCGRNGVGKSTLCDAFEFVLTGTIAKYHVERAAGETLEDYLWWRGKGIPDMHYVRIGVEDENGDKHIIERSRERGLSMPESEVRDLLVGEGGPEGPEALRMLCRTALIRDEQIAALSLDLTERERFELLRTALGDPEAPTHLEKAAQVVKSAENARQRAQEEARQQEERRLQAWDELELLKAALTAEADTTKALDQLRRLTGAEIDPASAPESARQFLSQARLRVHRLGELLSRIELAQETLEKAKSVAFTEERSMYRGRVTELSDRVQEVQGRQTELEELATQQRETNTLASELAALLRHGTELGLRDGHCPLCDAERTEKEFQGGIEAAEQHLARLSKSALQLEERKRQLEADEQKITKALSEAQDRLAVLDGQAKEAESLQTELASGLERLGLDQTLISEIAKLQEIRDGLQDDSLEVERALRIIETSGMARQITAKEQVVRDLESAVSTAQSQLDRLSSATGRARTLDRAIKRAAGEALDRRLARIGPLFDELYQRLRPHPSWRSIGYQIRGDVRRFLRLTVGEELNPQFLFSSGQRRVAGLAFLLSVHLARSWAKLNTLILDDPVQHIDDYRSLHLVEVLTAVRKAGLQIVCAVEDESLADCMSRRLPGTIDSPNVRYDIGYAEKEGPEVLSRKELWPYRLALLGPESRRSA